MRRTRATDARELPHPPAAVYDVLLEWREYGRWWPASIRFDLLEQTSAGVGSRARITPVGASFVCQVLSADPPRRIEIGYSGLHAGTGIWTLEPTPAGTRLTYAIDLEPQGPLPRLLSDWIDFASLHSAMMQRVFDGLARHLDTRAAHQPA